MSSERGKYGSISVNSSDISISESSDSAIRTKNITITLLALFSVHKCNPIQSPKLDPQIGTCSNFGDNICGGDFLVEAGLERARCIARKANYSTLKRIHAQNPGTCDDKGKVKREYQTILPLALRYNITIETQFHRGEEFQAALHLKNRKLRDELCNIKNETGSVLYCWNHENIPSLLQAFGCLDDLRCRIRLDQEEYDHIYRLNMYCANGSFSHVEELHEGCNAESHNFHIN
eukprot:gene1702-3296_t